VHLQPGLCAQDGTPVAAAGPWQFDTGGPKVGWQHPQPGEQVTEQQVFLLEADAPLARDTLADALLIRVADQAPQVVTVLGLPQRPSMAQSTCCADNWSSPSLHSTLARCAVRRFQSTTWRSVKRCSYSDGCSLGWAAGW